mgnify:FL=1
MYAKRGLEDLQPNGISANSFEELADIAVADLKRQGRSGIVCGPITTGGTGVQKYNFQIFNATIKGLETNGVAMFSQMPYEFGIRRLTVEWHKHNSGYCEPILEVFYAALLESGLIDSGHFLPGWASSYVARYEREKLATLKVPILDVDFETLTGFVEDEHGATHAKHVLSLLRQNCT